MSIEIIASIISALAALLAGSVAASDLSRTILRRILGREEPPKPYGERLQELMGNLTRSSREVDAILAELAQVAAEREVSFRNLESELANLEEREKELQGRIEILEQIPIPVAEHFAQLIEGGERRSARRDYMLFGAGVLVSTLEIAQNPV